METRELKVENLHDGITLLVKVDHKHLLVLQTQHTHYLEVHQVLHLLGKVDGPAHDAVMEVLNDLDLALDHAAAGVWN